MKKKKKKKVKKIKKKKLKKSFVKRKVLKKKRKGIPIIARINPMKCVTAFQNSSLLISTKFLSIIAYNIAQKKNIK